MRQKRTVCSFLSCIYICVCVCVCMRACMCACVRVILTIILCARFWRGRANQRSVFFEISTAGAVGTTVVIGLNHQILPSLSPVLFLDNDLLENVPKHKPIFMSNRNSSSLFHGKKFLKLSQ